MQLKLQLEDLATVFNRCGTDKASKHRYDSVYEPFFQKKLKEKEVIHILEIGTFKGESTRAFLEYFPNVKIWTIDIFKRVAMGDIPILQDQRVTAIKGDSRDPETYRMICGIRFDFIIDDGLHTPEANQKTLHNTWPFLDFDGVYFIEDVWPISKMGPKELNHHWIRHRKEDYSHVKYREFEASLKNLKRSDFDLREETGEPDSYIIALQNNE